MREILLLFVVLAPEAEPKKYKQYFGTGRACWWFKLTLKLTISLQSDSFFKNDQQKDEISPSYVPNIKKLSPNWAGCVSVI